ncbi:ATP-binding protein, partial [Methylobacter sp.]|uniref:PAS domain-containing sensor histidine kinase n=1 Tax=Methylobacter sp. TaxID=2051955 RepID=UPI002489A180
HMPYRFWGLLDSCLAAIDILLTDESHHIFAKLRENYIGNAQARPVGKQQELRVKTKEGRGIPVEVSFSPINTSKGLLIAAALRDISQRKMAESALAKSEIKFLVNAGHAIEKKGEITITTRVCPSDNTAIQVLITDTGAGIPPENLKRIFDPFFTTKPVGQGTGLGLSITWGIIAKHHDTIDVNSTVGVGSTFTITLPVDQYDA